MEDALSFTLSKPRGAARRTRWVLLALLCGPGLPACVMLGFDPVPEEQAPIDAAGSSAVPLAGASAGAGAGAAGTAAPIAGAAADPTASSPMDTIPPSDAGGTVLDDASAMNEGGDAEIDAAACDENACGGCSVLSEAPGTSCGECGAGHYACAGSDDVVCEDEDALPVAQGSDGLIDDFEDGDGLLPNTELRSGGWYTTGDGSGGIILPSPLRDFTPVADGYGGSAHAARVIGGGFIDWGATLAVPLNENTCPYDASTYNGISFRARGAGVPRFSLATIRTVPFGVGGVCFDACFDHFTIEIPLSEQWQRYDIPFFAFQQSGWGSPAFFDPSELLYLEFFFDIETDFDLVVDDLEFF